MTPKEYRTEKENRETLILKLKQEISNLGKAFIEENKPIESPLPVKIHIKQTLPEKSFYRKIDTDAFIERYNIIEGTVDGSAAVCPVLRCMKKDGTVGRNEVHYAKYGKIEFWELGKEDEIHMIDFDSMFHL